MDSGAVFDAVFLWKSQGVSAFGRGAGLEAYEQYVLLLDNGISAKMVLELNGEQVSGAITKPSDADLEAFFVHYTENPLCQDAADREAVVACLVDILKDKGCVRLATCADCVYGCED